MNAWKITRIPSIQGESQFGRDAHYHMRQILFSLHNLDNTNISLELSFVHATGEEIEIYMFLRNELNGGIASVLEMQLSAANYQFERLDGQSAAAISQKLTDISCNSMHAVVKTEKIVTTPYIQEQYYYWADALLADENREMTEQFDIHQAPTLVVIRNGKMEQFVNLSNIRKYIDSAAKA